MPVVKTQYDMTLKFAVNLAFWQLLKQYRLRMAKSVNPEMKRIEQTFLVKLFENAKGPLQMQAVLTDIVKRFNDDGKKSKQSESGYTTKFSKYESNILTIVSVRVSLYLYGHHINNYGETNKITVTGNKPRTGQFNTIHKGFVFH